MFWTSSSCWQSILASGEDRDNDIQIIPLNYIRKNICIFCKIFGEFYAQTAQIPVMTILMDKNTKERILLKSRTFVALG